MPLPTGRLDPAKAVARLRSLVSIDALLTDEERMVRDQVRAFVAREVLPHVGRHFEDKTFPLDEARRLGSELGLFGCTLPPEYGGSGASHVAYGLANQELEYGGSGWRSMLSVQSGLVMYPIHAFGSEAQRRRYLPRLASGEIIGCFGLTEPNSGSDPGSMRTTLRRRGDGWVLDGAKAWITNGSAADVAVVWAKDDDGRVRGVLVERGTPGFTARDETHKYAMRASITSALSFEDTPVEEDGILPGARSLGAPLRCLNQARYGIGWGALGSACFTLEHALGYALEREQFGSPIAAFQLQQEKLAWMFAEVAKAYLLALHVGRLKDAGSLEHVHVSLLKRNNVWMARECARLAREMFGAYGVSGEYPIWRHLADLEAVYTYEGTHDVHTLILGEALTGIPSFRRDPA
ncbi:MAG: acyl-CoA dehydrogenase family protein [Deltaproteobacteria bacterium]|nr:acyl-CoA dehydrogenase family protein [Deltaproteobacteria bacterium]